MIMVERDLGPEWVPDSLEWWDLLVAVTNDHEMLRLAREGQLTLSVFELLAIRARARRGIELCLEHERNPLKRAWLERKLRPSATWEENKKLAKSMLAEMKEKRQWTVTAMSRDCGERHSTMTGAFVSNEKEPDQWS
jgi:hypothetical protein